MARFSFTKLANDLGRVFGVTCCTKLTNGAYGNVRVYGARYRRNDIEFYLHTEYAGRFFYVNEFDGVLNISTMI